MIKEYYILDNGQQTGPYTYTELLNQSITLDTLILISGDTEWITAADLPELAAYFQSKGISVVTEDSLASFWIRLAAFFIDCAVMFVLIVIGTIIYAVSSPGAVITPADVQRNENLINLTLRITFILYNVILEATPLQGSLGKLICGLKVIDESGQRLAFGQALFRNAGKVLSELAFGLGYLYIFWSPYNQAWHDQLAKTYIIRKPASVH